MKKYDTITELKKVNETLTAMMHYYAIKANNLEDLSNMLNNQIEDVLDTYHSNTEDYCGLNPASDLIDDYNESRQACKIFTDLTEYLQDIVETMDDTIDAVEGIHTDYFDMTE